MMVKRMLAPRGGSKCKTAQLLKGQSVRRALHSRDGNLLGRLLRPQLARRNIACHELTQMRRLTIGELARTTHVNRETVRYYERRRLLPRPSRSASGYRVFADDAVRRLRFIRHAQELGFSLNEIRELLALRVRTVDTCESVKERAQAKIGDIERKIRALQQMRRVLGELVNACARRRNTDECPILDSLEAAHNST